MTIENFTPLPALAGGVLIGSSTALVLFLNGKIVGISGIFGRLFTAIRGDTAWRAAFLTGMLAGGAAAFAAWPGAAAFTLDAGWARLAVAGFLVGLGTRVGGGCTSGHGVCGIGRGSGDSIGATLAFMAAGAATVYVTHHVLAGGAP